MSEPSEDWFQGFEQHLRALNRGGWSPDSVVGLNADEEFSRWMAHGRAQALVEAADAMPKPSKYDSELWDGEQVRYHGWEAYPNDQTPATWLRARAAQEAHVEILKMPIMEWGVGYDLYRLDECIGSGVRNCGPDEGFARETLASFAKGYRAGWILPPMTEMGNLTLVRRQASDWAPAEPDRSIEEGV